MVFLQEEHREFWNLLFLCQMNFVYLFNLYLNIFYQHGQLYPHQNYFLHFKFNQAQLNQLKKLIVIFPH
jgi:hypothetical protein